MAYKRKFITKVDKQFFKLDREAALVEQKYHCKYCNVILTKTNVTADHKIALANTNRYHTKENIVAACLDCNREKGTMTDDEYIVFRIAKITDWDLKVKTVFEEIEMRVRLAEYNLSFDTKGSFKKWMKFHEKNGRWN